MKVYITRLRDDKGYEIWDHNDLVWDGRYYVAKEGGINKGLMMHGIKMKDAKSMFNLPRHLKKREIVEAEMTFKVKVK